VTTIVHRSFHNAHPQYLSSLLHTYTPTRQLRSTSLNLLSQPRAKIALASRGFRHAGPSIWNSLPPHLRSFDTYTAFKSNLKTDLFCSASISAPNNSIHVLLIHIYVLILAPKLLYLTLKIRRLLPSETWSHPLQVIAAEAVSSGVQTQASRARLIAAVSNAPSERSSAVRECWLHSLYHCRQRLFSWIFCIIRPLYFYLFLHCLIISK